jgi:NAD(P)-dependent dehydrogenase (short-subunit alcohol dehydrogenase family)
MHRPGSREPTQLAENATVGQRFDLGGKVALVTGGSRGLGRAMVMALAAAGADVAIASRKLENSERLADEVTEATGRRAVAIAADVGNWEDIERLVEVSYERFERIDVLVNNAGMSPLYPDLESVSERLWDKVLAVNLAGPFRLTALVGSRMAADGAGGSVINISSAASTHVRPDALPYSAAKAGLNALTQGFAHAWPGLVRVNAIIPGPFLTDVSRAWDSESFEKHTGALAARRGGLPGEITGAAIYLAGDASSFTTGSLLRVDGGYVG